MAAAVIAYAVLGWTEVWQWGGIFAATYLMELIAVYLSLPAGPVSNEYDESDNESGRKMPKMKRKF